MQATLENKGRSKIARLEFSSSLNIFIVYDSVLAGRRGVRMVTNLCHDSNDRIELNPQLWRVDFLQDPDWFSIALADAGNADLVVIAMSAPSSLDATVKKWINLWVTRKRGTHAAIVGLIGSETNTAGPSPQLDFLQSAAREAGLDFFAPESSGDLPLLLKSISCHTQSNFPESTIPQRRTLK